MDDSRQIENLIYRYAELIDDGELEAVAELFRDAEIVAPGSGDQVTAGFEEVLAMYESATRLYDDTSTPKTRHLTTNVIIDVEGSSGSARSYFTVIQATTELPLQPIISGRYHDEFKKEGGRWRFKRRCMIIDLVGDLSAHLLFPAEQLQGG